MVVCLVFFKRFASDVSSRATVRVTRLRGACGNGNKVFTLELSVRLGKEAFFRASLHHIVRVFYFFCGFVCKVVLFHIHLYILLIAVTFLVDSPRVSICLSERRRFSWIFLNSNLS